MLIWIGLFIGLASPDEPAPSPGPPARLGAEECLERVRTFHGGCGPWAVVGHRIGEHALRTLKQPRGSFAVEFHHHAPEQVQYACMCDGLQAATGATLGKLNLKLIPAAIAELNTVARDRKTGRAIRYTLKPELIEAIRDLPMDRLEAEGTRVAGLADDDLFVAEAVEEP